MVKTLISPIKNKFYTYVPGEFIPVYVDGKLDNKSTFYTYKARRAAWRIRNGLL